jgi:hyperosmotically inducible periplasmic protein
MFGALIRLVLVAVIVVGALALFAGYRLGDGTVHPASESPVGTTGSRPAIDPERARERGAEAGERVASAINRAGEAVSDAGLTAKIKSKMALDDLVRARSIDVTTSGQIVTLSGTVASEAERTRAVQLAKETAGVTQVVDRLSVVR